MVFQTIRRDTHPLARFARMFTLSDLLTIAPRKPGRPNPDALTLRRRRLAARLADERILSIGDVALLVDVNPSTLYRWREAARRSA